MTKSTTKTPGSVSNQDVNEEPHQKGVKQKEVYGTYLKIAMFTNVNVSMISI